MKKFIIIFLSLVPALIFAAGFQNRQQAGWSSGGGGGGGSGSPTGNAGGELSGTYPNPTLSRSVTPTWIGVHLFNAGINLPTSDSSIGIIYKNNVPWIFDGHNTIPSDSTTNFYAGFAGNTAATFNNSSNNLIGYACGGVMNGASYNNVVGSGALKADIDGVNNNGCGDHMLDSTLHGSVNNGVGDAFCSQLNFPGDEDGNSGVGDAIMINMTRGSNNAGLGESALGLLLVGHNNVCAGSFGLGYNNGLPSVSFDSSASLGSFAGEYNTQSNQVYIDVLERNNLTGNKTLGLIWGSCTTAGTGASGQQLTINGTLKPNQGISVSGSSAYDFSGSTGAFKTSSGTFTISSLTSNGFVKTSGSTGATSIDTTVYVPANGTTTVRALVTTVGSLPSANPSGQNAFVTDANTTVILGLGLIVVGGGTNFSPVYSDGTNWRQY